MKAFRQTIQELSTNDKLDKLGHNKPLTGSRLKQLTRDFPAYEDIDLDQWQGYPPPRNSSQVTKNEIHNLISLGQFRDQWERDMIMHDKKVIQAFREYLDKHGLEVDLDRIEKLRKQASPILLSLKRFYNRPRPNVLAKKLDLTLTFFPLKTAETPSYPSGHSTQGRLVAKLIADEVPFEHRRNILDIGTRIGHSRQIAGAHYQSDTEFGHRLGDELYRLASTRKEPELSLEYLTWELDMLIEDDAWWRKLDAAGQAQYMRDHPGSKKAMQAKAKAKKKKEKAKKKDQAKEPEVKTKEPKKEKPKHSLKTDKARDNKMHEVADLFVTGSSETKGAGRFTMSQKDVTDYKTYLKLSEKERQAKLDDITNKQRERVGEITDEDVENTKEYLRKKLGTQKYNALVASVKKKGAPPPAYSQGDAGKERVDAVIKHYLETGGVSPITGEVVPFSDSQLDHIVSLDNGGKDGPENWMWMESRVNQFKGALTDPEVERKLTERGLMTVNEISKETKETEFKNWKDESMTAYWHTKFESGDLANLSHEKIDNMTAAQLKQLVKGWNRYVGGKKDPRFIARYGARTVEIEGSKKPLEMSRGGEVKPDKDNPKSWGVIKGKDGNLSKPKFENDEDGYKKAKAAYDADSRVSGGRNINKPEVLENIKNRLSSDNTPFGHPIPDASDEQEIDEAFESIQNEKEAREDEIKKLDAIIKANPDNSTNIKKQIDKVLKTEPDKEKRAALRIQLWKDHAPNEQIMSFKQWIS